MVSAAQVAQLAQEVRPRLAEIQGLGGHQQQDISRHGYVVEAEDQQQLAQDTADKAGVLLASPIEKRSDEELAAMLRSLDEYQVQLDTMRQHLNRRLESLREDWRALWTLRARERANDRTHG